MLKVRQVLTGILPISRVSAVPLCVHHAAQLLPLERVLGLTHPAAADAEAAREARFKQFEEWQRQQEAAAKEPKEPKPRHLV